MDGLSPDWRFPIFSQIRTWVNFTGYTFSALGGIYQDLLCPASANIHHCCLVNLFTFIGPVIFILS